MATYGYRPGAVAASYGTHAELTTNQRAYVGPRMTEHGWFYRWGGRIGVPSGGTARVAGAVWATDAGDVQELLERTDQFDVATAMTSASNGQDYLRSLRSVVKGRSGSRYAIGKASDGAGFAHGTMPPSGIAASEYKTTFYRSLSVPTPTDPFGATSQGENGWPAFWLEYEPNVAPDVPGDLSPSDGATGLTLTPTFAGNFRDANEVVGPNDMPADSLNKIQLRVYRVDLGSLFVVWDYTRDATAAERTARAWSIPYAGSALFDQIEHRWEARVSDQFGVWSDWTPMRSFTPGGPATSLGGMSPTGKIETRTPTFGFVYSHSQGTSANAYQVRITDRVSGQQVRVSAIVNTTISNGATVTAAWAGLAMTALDWGGKYRYQVRARDAGGKWSGWGGTRSFDVNAAPSVPTGLTPENGQEITSFPLLTCIATDDDDSVATGLQVFARIRDSDDIPIATVAMTLNTGTGWWEYQTTEIELPSYDEYTWDAFSYDGTVYSGGVTVGMAQTSDPITFTFLNGPDVVVVSPTEEESIATTMPLYDWTSTGQTKFQVQVWQTFEDDSQIKVYDTGEIVSTATQHRQAAGYLDSQGGYYLIVTTWNGSNQRGVSQARHFRVDVAAPPPPTGFQASPYTARGDRSPTAILLSWDETEYDEDQFVCYIVYRAAVSGTPVDVDDPIGTDAIRIAKVTGPGDTRFIDFLPASGVTYRYGVRQVVLEGSATLESVYTTLEASVSFEETVICAAALGGRYRASGLYRGDRRIPRRRQQKVITPWGVGKPEIQSSPLRYREVAVELKLIASDDATVQDQIRWFDELDARSSAGDVLCYRDGRGNRYFGQLTEFEELDPAGGKTRRVSLGFVQTGAREVRAT